MITNQFLNDKFYIHMSMDTNRYIPSKYLYTFDTGNDSGYNNFYACGQDGNGNILIKNIYNYCTDYDYENDRCEGTFYPTQPVYYVLTKENNLYAYSRNDFDSSFRDDLMSCECNIYLSLNKYDDFLYTGQTNEILPLMFYFSIPLLIVLFAVKVFRKGVH